MIRNENTTSELDGILTREEMQLWVDERDAWLEEQDKGGEDILITTTRKKLLEEDDDFIGYFAGKKGSGKSTCCMRYQIKLDRKWVPWKRIGFTALEIMYRLKEAQKGWGVFWDETGAGWNALRFMSTESVESDKVFTIIREKNLAFGFTGPTFMDMAKAPRRLCTLIFALEKNPKGEGQIYYVSVGAIDGRIYTPGIGEFRFDALPISMYAIYKKYRTNYLEYVLEKAIQKLEISAVRKELTPKLFEVWFAVYRSEGLTFSELKSMFPQSTTIHACNVLKRWGFFKKESGEQARWQAFIPRDLR